MFISLSMVSAENMTDTSDLNSEESSNSLETGSSAEITKITNDVKTSTSPKKSASKVSIDSQSVKYNTTIVLDSTVTDKNGNGISDGTVVYKINGKTIGNAEVNKGLASLTYKLTNMAPKTYNITVKYAENDNYLESIGYSKLTLLKHSSKITVDSASVIRRDVVTLSAKVTDAESDNLATSGKVAFKINGKTIGYATVSKGIAHCSYNTSKLSAKIYEITASYGGNSFLNSATSKKNFLTVNAIPTVMTVNKVTSYSSSVVLKATVAQKYNSEYVPSGVVVFKINDKTIGNSTISDGKVSLTYDTTKLTRGTYKITAILKPTSTYASSSASNDLIIKVQDYFTFSQIKSAAVNVRTQIESNNIVNSVVIGKSRMTLSEFLALMIQATDNVYRGKSSTKVPYVYYNAITTQTDSMKTGVLSISEVREIGERTLNFMKNNGRPPKYVSTEYGKIGYYNIIYTYTRVLDVSTSDYLVSTCRVYHWNNIHPTNSKSRTIYITSDIIYNSAKDHAYMNKIKAKLESYGYTVKIGGYGPNSHVSKVWDKTLPANAVQLSIFGGADAGVIYDVCTRSFMRTKESRLMFYVFYSDTSTDITGLKFLKRAHDDNYMPSSFKGLENPDVYLKSHGYDYVYTTNVDTIAKALINYIS